MRSPYSSERYGAMLAYVKDGNEPSRIARVEAAIGEAEPAFVVVETFLPGGDVVTTRHDRTIDSPEHGVRERRITDVVNLVLEFDASPDLRPASSVGRSGTVA